MFELTSSVHISYAVVYLHESKMVHFGKSKIMSYFPFLFCFKFMSCHFCVLLIFVKRHRLGTYVCKTPLFKDQGVH